jgi:hypothetical protein
MLAMRDVDFGFWGDGAGSSWLCFAVEGKREAYRAEGRQEWGAVVAVMGEWSGSFWGVYCGTGEREVGLWRLISGDLWRE